MSPVEICGMPKRRQITLAWVPLPAPGAPSRMSLIDVLDGVVLVVREKVAAPFGRRPAMGHYRRPNAAALP
jgi:hypothetical protein